MERVIAIVTDKRHEEEFLTLVKEAGFNVHRILYVRNITSKILSDYKLHHLRELLEKENVEKIVFDVSLRPKQTYRIAKATRLEVLDRIEVILRIFLAHAPSQEAKLQVKLASLRYELARAKEKVRLAKSGEQPGFSGLGAYEVDVYYREIKKRISNILMKLSRIRRRRKTHRISRLRRTIKTVSITGYTCSGKTTLFNALTNSFEKVGDEPFTTLSTKFKLVRIGPWRVYFSDTIGFIRNLPPFMVHAFRSTLEEVSFSDIVILMLDVSESHVVVKEKFKTCFNLLVELGVINKPIIVALNKIDLVKETEKLENIERYVSSFTPYVINISARKEVNLNRLRKLVAKLLGLTRKIEISIPNTSPNYYLPLELVKERGRLLKFKPKRDKMIIYADIPETFINQLEAVAKSLGGSLRLKS